VANAVLDAQTSDHTQPGSVGEAIKSGGDGGGTSTLTLAEIEASAVLAKSSEVAAVGTAVNQRPTLAEITGSSLAKTSDVTSVGSAVASRPTLAQIEASAVLAKSSEVGAVASAVGQKPSLADMVASSLAKTADVTAVGNAVSNRPTLAQIEASAVIAKEATAQAALAAVQAVSDDVAAIPTAAQVASQLLAELVIEHLQPGSVGEALALIRGLLHHNVRVAMTYDINGVLQTSQLEVMRTAEDVDNPGAVPLAVLDGVGAPSENGRYMASYKVKRR
jgi:hypothetical protein